MLGSFISATSNSSAGGIAMLIVFGAVMILLSYAVTVIVAKFGNTDKDNAVSVGKLRTGYVFLIILAAGLIARLLFVFFINGYGKDYVLAYNVAYAFKTNGDFSKFTTDYLGVGPLLGYIFMIFGNMGFAFNLSKDALWMQFFLKLPYILADIGVALVLYFAGKKYSNGFTALALSALYFLNPVFFMLSSIWGSPASIYVLALVLTAYFVLEKNIFGMTVSAVAGLLLNSVFMFTSAIVLAYLVYLLVQSIQKIVMVKPTMSEISKDNTLANVYYVPVCLLLGFMLVYLLALPAFLPDGVGMVFDVYGKLFIAPFEFNAAPYAYTYFADNSVNIFTIFIQNGVEISNKFPTLVYTAVMLGITLAIAVVAFLFKKNRANLVLMLSYIAATVAVFFVSTDAWAAAPALAVLILAYTVIKDKRILHIFAILSVIVTVNAVLAMIGAGQIGQVLVETEFFFKNDELLNVFSILLSVLSVIMEIYFTVVALDISLTKHRYVFDTDEESGIGECIRAWYRRS